MRVIQIVPTLSYGDGVSNDCLAIYKVLKAAGYQTAIYAGHIGKSLPKVDIYGIEKLGVAEEDDVIIYHLSSGHNMNFMLGELKGKKILRYHNITPGIFFAPYNRGTQRECDYGRAGLRYLADKVDYCLADSDYNGMELKALGYQCPIETMPIAIRFKDYNQEPDQEIIRKYKDGRKNFIFTGRIAPNKCQEDVIRVFYLYKKYYDETARLFLVGSWSGMEKYYQGLRDYVDALGVPDVHFTGHVPFGHILAYYHLADGFVCMSEHEGFCIPLVEAMYFNIPIIAYDSSAVGETLGQGGILLKEKEFLLGAACLAEVQQDKLFRDKILSLQRKRLEYFSSGEVEKLLGVVDQLKKDMV